MSRDGPQASRDKLARIFALLPEHSLLHVGHDLEDDAEDVERPTDIVLQVCNPLSCRLFPLTCVKFPLPGDQEEDSSSVR